MKCYKIQLLVTLSFILLLPNTKGWGEDGHAIVCRIAQSRLSDSAADAVKNLLPKYAQNDLGSVCSWADRVRFYLHWSSALHFADTPDKLCNYQYDRDCKDQDGEKGRCVVGAIKNYTDQLLDYGKDTQYNLTQALLFLSHFMGDVHQPLHVGFTSDKGGNLINIHWYRRKQNLHHKTWSDQVRGWETCNSKETTCPDIYASEGIEAACKWAYKDAPEGSVLEDDYFLSRLPEVSLRLAQGGVRLAATLNRIFG
ncbi:endonuclease 2 isoform X2 [Vigna radiata var. radiata]|uniref:Aspergillus nuclease S1 n=1 Tax=Vigna radiata var. radiata TaxID=3916 RepID=A0A3Q0FGL9_VIGRR|nr:endonuclease 2 isoform X2 [Vigna radiata var. radiata]